MVFKGDEILLGLKKRGFGEGRWNGFGGKLNEGESIESAAVREIQEEVGLNVKTEDLKKAGILDFEYQNEQKMLEVHVFKIYNFTGEPIETEEMKPQWFHLDQIPFDTMWPDDEHWFPYLLDEGFFKGRFLFDKPSSSEYTSEILEFEIEEVESLD